MNWAQFEDPVPHMCLDGAVVASWSLTQEVTGSSATEWISYTRRPSHYNFCCNKTIGLRRKDEQIKKSVPVKVVP